MPAREPFRNGSERLLSDDAGFARADALVFIDGNILSLQRCFVEKGGPARDALCPAAVVRVFVKIVSGSPSIDLLRLLRDSLPSQDRARRRREPGARCW